MWLDVGAQLIRDACGTRMNQDYHMLGPKAIEWSYL
jgi:hypothetical protein